MTVSDAAAEHNIEKVRLGGRRDIENEGMSFRGSKARPMQAPDLDDVDQGLTVQ